MRAIRSKVDSALVQQWAVEIGHSVEQAIRVVTCEDLIVVDFLSCLRFRYSPATQSLVVSYRSPTGFWLDAPDDLKLSAEAPLQWLWTRCWLAPRRSEIAKTVTHSGALEFAELCDRYAAALLKKLPAASKRKLEKALIKVLRGESVINADTQQRSTCLELTSPTPVVSFRSFAEMLAAVAAEAEFKPAH